MLDVQKAFTPIVIIYFILLVFIGNFFLLNLLLAVIIVKFNEATSDEADKANEISITYQEINMIFPENDHLYRENDYKIGIEFAKMKIRAEKKFLEMSLVENLVKKNQGTEALGNSRNDFTRTAVVDLFLRSIKVHRDKEYDEGVFKLQEIRKRNVFLPTDVINSIMFYPYDWEEMKSLPCSLNQIPEIEEENSDQENSGEEDGKPDFKAENEILETHATDRTNAPFINMTTQQDEADSFLLDIDQRADQIEFDSGRLVGFGNGEGFTWVSAKEDRVSGANANTTAGLKLNPVALNTPSFQKITPINNPGSKNTSLSGNLYQKRKLNQIMPTDTSRPNQTLLPSDRDLPTTDRPLLAISNPNNIQADKYQSTISEKDSTAEPVPINLAEPSQV